MAINVRVITRPDPGAIPGGSTNPFSRALGGDYGADQDRRMGKDVAFARMGSVISPLLKLPTTTLLKKCVSLRKRRDHFAS